MGPLIFLIVLAFLMLLIHNNAQNSSVELAMGDIMGNFTGASASLNVWNPYVELDNEYSASQVTLVSENNTNIIDMGWHVYPQLYGDNETHFFVRWSIIEQGGRVGCFNTDCQGFVQTSTNVLAGESLYDMVSILNSTQYTTTVSILQNEDGEWWVTNDNEEIGYFPSSLLPELRYGATMISYGGRLLDKWNMGRHTFSEMGSGLFPLAGYRLAAFQSNLAYVKDGNSAKVLFGSEMMSLSFENVGKCYYVYVEEPTGRLYFGGSGFNPRCQT